MHSTATHRILARAALPYVKRFAQSMSPSELDNAPEVKYQERIVEVAYDEWESPILAQFVSCDAAVGRESTKAINRDVMRLTVGYILLIVYTFIVLWRNRWVGGTGRGGQLVGECG